ncbi:sodium channel and clathrin linker 1 isoform X1 [Pipistrellus kuhlii]|uniref:Sodium channel and clathrin linker 1 n=1 Tax=Pipistrellus kuhlii TaxID=59472 RepID=A0A7J7XD83_PIPKU|nr:sodium channel and clathrin linker 1 isoform X1 [Pipistrellus kuhlii]KAF6347346.1 sodium channel and clathrin linker 1 [Pipistrellus kuhlii]
MAKETDPLREKTQRLNEVLRLCQMENVSKYSTVQKAAFKGEGGDILGNLVVDQSFSAPLITEYDKHLEELNGQLKHYQKQVGEMKLQLESVIKENERLHSELKDAVVKQLEALPFDTETGNDIYIDDETVRNLQEQLQLANKEKNYVLELWQNVSQELNRVKKLCLENQTEAQIKVIEGKKQKNQLTNSQQLNKKLYANTEGIEMGNQHLLKTITEQSVEIEQLRKQLRQAKLDMRVAVAKVEQLTQVTEDFQGQMQKKEEDMVTSQRREEASDRRLQQLQSSIKQLETRLCVTVQEATQLRADKIHLEKQTRELQTKYNELEKERYEAVVTSRNSMQLLEEANLQKNQALLEEKQKEEEIEKIKKSFSQFMQEAATRAKKEISNSRKQYQVQISRLTEELSALQMECTEKQGQIERVIKEKKAVEEELEKVYREGKVNENHYRKLEEMHQRCLVAECSKDDLQLRLKTAENKLKQFEINSSEEISRCQEMIQKLQNLLESERENCGFVSEQRLKLQQENEQLQKETEDLRKMALEAQKKAKLKISAMEHEFSVKEHGFEVQLRELEDTNRNSTVELRHLLATQQKAANRWKEETKRLTESSEMRISNLKSELSRQKLHTQELLSQLEMANEKVVESEKLILEHQEKASRLQRRLNQAEQRAASASQQLSVVTVQRRKAASMMNLENL